MFVYFFTYKFIYLLFIYIASPTIKIETQSLDTTSNSSKETTGSNF